MVCVKKKMDVKMYNVLIEKDKIYITQNWSGICIRTKEISTNNINQLLTALNKELESRNKGGNNVK